jgi:hypothetical protein
VLVPEPSLAAAVDPDPLELPPQAVSVNTHSMQAVIRSACDALTVQLIIDPAEEITASRG